MSDIPELIIVVKVENCDPKLADPEELAENIIDTYNDERIIGSPELSLHRAKWGSPE